MEAVVEVQVEVQALAETVKAATSKKRVTCSNALRRFRLSCGRAAQSPSRHRREAQAPRA